MLFGKNGAGGENDLTAFFEIAQQKLAKEGRVSRFSNGYSLGGQVTPSSKCSIGGQVTPSSKWSKGSRDFIDQESGSPTFVSSRNSRSVAGMERELKSSIAKLYQNYDFVTDEYDRLYEIVDRLREEYNNSKNLLFYNRYKEFRRIIKNALRQWRSVEKRSTLAMSRKTSNTNYSMAMSLHRPSPGGGSTGSVADGTFSQNLDARLKAQSNNATRDLYAECTRLEREIYQYKARNQTIKNLICKLAESYENSKAHVLHIWGRFKELRAMIKEVIDSDV